MSSPKSSSPSSPSSFGQAVESLLETYSRCLSLLKSLRRQEEEEEEEETQRQQQAASASSQQQQAQLNSSLRSDRASIRRAYSSRLLQDGARLDQGDAAARSSLRRVIKRLTTALADVVRILARRQPRSADYDSLMALSSMSSVDAIRTINDLSSRISGAAASSPSTSSVSTRSNAGSRRTRSRHSSAARLGKKGATVTSDRRSHSRSGSSSSSTSTRSVRRSRKSNNKRRDQHHDPHHPPHASTVAAGAAHRPKVHGTKRDSSGSSSSSSTHRRRSSANAMRIRDDANGHRLSMATMSSDSTKLGEVRRRRSTMGLKLSPRVTYPLYPYHYRAEDKPKKKWWGVFGG